MRRPVFVVKTELDLERPTYNLVSCSGSLPLRGWFWGAAGSYWWYRGAWVVGETNIVRAVFAISPICPRIKAQYGISYGITDLTVYEVTNVDYKVRGGKGSEWDVSVQPVFPRGWFYEDFETLVPIEVSGGLEISYWENPKEVGDQLRYVGHLRDAHFEDGGRWRGYWCIWGGIMVMDHEIHCRLPHSNHSLTW